MSSDNKFRMEKVRVFIDSSIYIAWLNKEEPEYYNIERIRGFVQDDIIESVTTLDIMKEIFQGINGVKDWEEIEKNFRPKKYYMTPNFIIGDTSGIYKAHINECISKWNSLSNLIGNTEDSKHFISAKVLAGVKYYLALDDRFFNKMRNEGENYIKGVKLVRPCELIKIVNEIWNSMAPDNPVNSVKP